MPKITFKIDGKQCTAEDGQNLVQAAASNNVYIPTLCHLKGAKCLGTCRVCMVKINGKDMAGCTLSVSEGMEVTFDTPELNDKRKALVEMMFVERNHFCPSCEKSGRCDLQALAYRFKMHIPRFRYRYPFYEVYSKVDKLMLDHNRCILCQRCVEFIREPGSNQKIFAMRNRTNKSVIQVDYRLANKMSEEQIDKAVAICPVGAILKKGQGFDEPYGQRKYDQHPIGYEVDGGTNSK